MTRVHTDEYTQTELLACVAAHLLEDGTSVFVGTGLPMIAAILAQRTHAPNLLIIFEAGGMGPQVPSLPISVGDSRTFHRAVAASSMHDVMSLLQNGYVDYGFLGAAAIDAHGNVNTTVIGDWERPKVRLPGSGGANDIGSLCWRTIVMMNQDKRRFVEQLDFLTTPGYLTGPGAREAAGLPLESGPYRVVTQLGVYDFEEETKRLRLVACHPGVTVHEVQANSGFEIVIPDEVGVTEAPTAEERQRLREIDPERIVLGR
ncbi:MAG: 3-oxoacid CoA-transferase [Anaerolineae bacterium]|nr:3-oxoacid CoA-transferase [Anaerolineae bacterium]